MIKKSQFIGLVKSVVQYKRRLAQLEDEYGDSEIAEFSDGLVDSIVDYLEDVMDDDKRAIIRKWLAGNYKSSFILCIKDGEYCDVDSRGNFEGYNRIKIQTIGQLYDFLKHKKDEKEI